MVAQVLDTLTARLASVDGALVGRSLGRLVRGEELEPAAVPHRAALLRLAFLAHVWAPALDAAALATSAMRAQLLEAGGMPASELLDDLTALLNAIGDPQKVLIVDSLERGFIGDRAGMALKAPDLFELDDEEVERMIAVGLPRRSFEDKAEA